MRTTTLALFAAIAAATTCGPTHGQPPAAPPVPRLVADPPPPLGIAGALVYEPHQLVRLRAEGVPAKAGVLWRVYPSAAVQRATTPKGLLEFAAPPGAYEVELLAITQTPDGGLDVAEARATVTVKSCHPPEPPPPGPNPPKPGHGKLDPPNAIGRIQFGSAGCSATVIGPRRPDGRWDVLTAAHCMGMAGQQGTMKMPASGKVVAVRVAVRDAARDIAWLETEPVEDLEYALLADRNPPVGAPVWHQGYGVDRPRSLETGTVEAGENQSGQLRFLLSVSSGDSGGGIFESSTNRVVSTVCCTSGMARKASMWGGSVEQAIKVRPVAKTDTFDSDWRPVEIPLRDAAGRAAGRDDWRPVAMPLVQAGWTPVAIPTRDRE